MGERIDLGLSRQCGPVEWCLRGRPSTCERTSVATFDGVSKSRLPCPGPRPFRARVVDQTAHAEVSRRGGAGSPPTALREVERRWGIPAPRTAVIVASIRCARSTPNIENLTRGLLGPDESDLEAASTTAVPMRTRRVRAATAAAIVRAARGRRVVVKAIQPRVLEAPLRRRTHAAIRSWSVQTRSRPRSDRSARRARVLRLGETRGWR